MDLKKIENPRFLKDLSIQELNDLAADIRTFLIETVSKTGGHLSSNLGVVELTIALHYCFDTPRDKVFFDVGHQCYVHKILTGRASQMSSIRQFGGIAGFQKRIESGCCEHMHLIHYVNTVFSDARRIFQFFYYIAHTLHTVVACRIHFHNIHILPVKCRKTVLTFVARRITLARAVYGA